MLLQGLSAHRWKENSACWA